MANFYILSLNRKNKQLVCPRFSHASTYSLIGKIYIFQLYCKSMGTILNHVNFYIFHHLDSCFRNIVFDMYLCWALVWHSVCGYGEKNDNSYHTCNYQWNNGCKGIALLEHGIVLEHIFHLLLGFQMGTFWRQSTEKGRGFEDGQALLWVFRT